MNYSVNMETTIHYNVEVEAASFTEAAEAANVRAEEFQRAFAAVTPDRVCNEVTSRPTIVVALD